MCDQFDAVYINLDRSEDRKQSFEAQDAFAACGMRRLAAVDGRTLDTSKAEGAPPTGVGSRQGSGISARSETSGLPAGAQGAPPRRGIA